MLRGASLFLSAVCTTAKQLYTSPTAGSTFDASSGPMIFTWNTDCTVADKVDLTLYSPESLQPIIKVRPKSSPHPATGGTDAVLLPASASG